MNPTAADVHVDAPMGGQVTPAPGGKKKPARYRMTALKMTAIAGVDRPAQEPAVSVAIMKRYDGPGPRKDWITSDTARDVDMTTAAQGHQHLVCDDGAAKAGETSWARSSADDVEGHAHPWVRNDDGTITIGMAEGHTHELIEDDGPDDLVDLGKRQFSAEDRKRLAESGAAMPDGSYPIETAADLSDAVRSWGRAAAGRRKAVAQHIRRRAKALGLTDKLPTSGPLADAMGTAKRDDTQEPDTMPNEIDDLKTRNAALSKRAGTLAAILAMSAAHAEYAKSLPEAEQEAFVAKGAAERDELIKGDVVYTAADGTVFRKSDDQRMVAMAKRADEAERIAKAERIAREDGELAKRAGEVLKHASGEPLVKAAVLRAVEAISDETTRSKGLALLKGLDAAAGLAFDKRGVGGGFSADAESPEARLNKLAEERAAKDDGPGNAQAKFAKAYAANLEDNLEARRLYAEIQNRRGVA